MKGSLHNTLAFRITESMGSQWASRLATDALILSERDTHSLLHDQEQDYVLPGQPKPMTTKWEYLQIGMSWYTSVITIYGEVNTGLLKDKKLRKKWKKDHALMLNYFGDEGWELVTTSGLGSSLDSIYTFKRVKTHPKKRLRA